MLVRTMYHAQSVTSALRRTTSPSEQPLLAKQIQQRPLDTRWLIRLQNTGCQLAISQMLSLVNNYLFDLCAGFDTLDHTILLHRLSSWFGLSFLSLQWFTHFTSSSPLIPLIYGILQGFVLGPNLSNLYTTHLHYTSQFSNQLIHRLTPIICCR